MWKPWIDAGDGDLEIIKQNIRCYQGKNGDWFCRHTDGNSRVSRIFEGKLQIRWGYVSIKHPMEV